MFMFIDIFSPIKYQAKQTNYEGAVFNLSGNRLVTEIRCVYIGLTTS